MLCCRPVHTRVGKDVPSTEACPHVPFWNMNSKHTGLSFPRARGQAMVSPYQIVIVCKLLLEGGDTPMHLEASHSWEPSATLRRRGQLGDGCPT
jgi:hypothetical protein